MIDLTVGEASALIAAGIALLQFVLPNVLALILTGNLNDSHSAVTWSVVSRFLLSTDWPLFLNSESTASSATTRRISVIAWLKPISLAIAAIAAIVTPLGLHDGIFPESSDQEVKFVYAVDKGVFGSSTPGRSAQYGFSRVCEDVLCPGELYLGNTTYTTKYNSTLNYTTSLMIRTPQIPQSLVDLYQSGLNSHSSSLSSTFDIEFRQWKSSRPDLEIVNNETYLVAGYKQLGTFLLDSKWTISEGIITDTITGSIGFRNHSVPTGLSYGAEWNEDILFFEPDTVCVNTNLTTYYSVSATGVVGYNNGIIDRGGFVNINKTFPVGTEYAFFNGQKDPKLYDKAYLAAWGINSLTMQYLNISTPHTNLSRISSSLGQKFLLNSSLASYTEFGSLGRAYALSSFANPPTEHDIANGTDPASYTNPEVHNPYNISSDMYSNYSQYCGGFYAGDAINISEIGTAISIIAGIGYRTDGGRTPGTFDASSATTPNSTWERPVYVCAGSTRAIIKTVRFRYNATIDNRLDGLYILDVQNKTYLDASKLPTWGFETPKPRYNVSNINPIWGLVDESKTKTANLSTLTSERFYIPMSQSMYWNYGSSDITSDYSDDDNVPATSGPSDIWSTTMSDSWSSSGYDYAGKTDPRLNMFWQHLTQNSTGVARGIRLLWTDYASNYLVGTKGLHTQPYRQPDVAPPSAYSKRQTSSSSSGQVSFPVYVLQHRIRYRWVYAIPALLIISIVAAAVLVAFVSMICGRGTVARLRWYMFNITSGRVLASFVYPDATAQAAKHADTKEWIAAVGNRPIQISDGAQSTGVDYQGHADAHTYVHGQGQSVGPEKGSGAAYMQVKQREDDSIDS